MIETIASFDGRIAKVQGPARSGKTEALVRRCACLVRGGAAPETILVETSSAAAAQAFRRRLRRAIGPDLQHAADDVHVRTALETCVAVLDAPAARAATGRVPRLLNDAEYNFFLEDMKTLGQPIRRLRKMLDFFYRQMSDLEPRDSWLAGGEEEAVLSHLERVLASRGAMLAQEAPSLCAAYLRSDAGEGVRGSYAYVLCDDFQNMSRAEQTCLCLLADRQLIACGNPNQQQAARASFPCAEGFVQFDARRRDVAVFTLSGAHGNPAIAAFADGLCDQGDMDPAFKAGIASDAQTSDGIMAVKWSTPEDELDGITKYLRILLDGEEDLHENRTCVLVPNKRWALMAQQVLKQRGFAVALAGAFSRLGGDPRDSARARALVAYTKLNLLADPRDMTAWRSWCGFDNYLTNSDAWGGLQAFAEKRELTLYDALALADQLEDEPFLRAHALVERWRAGQKLIAANVGRKGFGLLQAIGADGLPEFEETARALVGDEDAAAVFALQRARAARGLIRRPVRRRIRQHLRHRRRGRLHAAARCVRGDQHRGRPRAHHERRAPTVLQQRVEGQQTPGRLLFQQSAARACRACQDAGGAREGRGQRPRGLGASHRVFGRSGKRRPRHHRRPSPPRPARAELAAIAPPPSGGAKLPSYWRSRPRRAFRRAATQAFPAAYPAAALSAAGSASSSSSRRSAEGAFPSASPPHAPIRRTSEHRRTGRA